MKTKGMQTRVIGIMVFTALIVSGCSVVGLFLKDHDYVTKESWEIRTPPTDLFEAVADTGRSMGFDTEYGEVRNPPPGLEYWETKSPPPVDKHDVRFRSMILSRDHLNGLKAAVVGSRNVSSLTLYAWRGGEYMEVYVMVDGNVGSGTQEAAMKLLSDFRANLSKRIGEIAVIKHVPLAFLGPLPRLA